MGKERVLHVNDKGLICVGMSELPARMDRKLELLELTVIPVQGQARDNE
jgi:hypothetical protein